MRRLLLCLFAGLLGCAGRSVPTRPTGLEDLQITAIEPKLWVPGTRVVVRGSSFVDRTLGEPQLHVRGRVGSQPIDVLLQAEVSYVSPSELQFVVPMSMVELEGRFEGEAEIAYFSLVDGLLHNALPFEMRVDMKRELTPSAASIGAPTFVNDVVAVQGKDFLLSLPEGAEEGQTQAALIGCFQRVGSADCTPIMPVTIPAKSMSLFERTVVSFPYTTQISGIGPGMFKGRVQIQNLHKATRKLTRSMPLDVTWNIIAPRLVRAETQAGQEEKGMPQTTAKVSVGQYLFFRGGGFVGGRTEDPTTRNEVTLLHIDRGTFTPTAPMGPREIVGVDLLPKFRDGRTLAYSLSSIDAIGSLPGKFTGTITPVARKGLDEVRGTAANVEFEVVPPRQMVWVRFQDSYQYSLLYYGLHRADAEVRKRALEVMRAAYQGVNIVFQEQEPTSFELYSTVDISGPDPTGRSFGFDNSPGKDVGNLRLFDQVGGFYARQQGDTRKGYGGIFVEEMLSFSLHPPASIPTAKVASRMFDRIFDPFRTDMDGAPVSGHELGDVKMLKDGESCPASFEDRSGQIACAIFVLGNIIGDTAAHEVGHSLGLAYPDVKSDSACVHTRGNEKNRLMEEGGSRPFDERAQLNEQGPGIFCQSDYEYLRKILPSTEPATRIARPSCGVCTP